MSFDKVNQRLFGVLHNQLWMVDVATGAQEQINLMQKNQRFGQVMGIAYDSKRDRLILTSHNRVFAFNPNNKEVTALRLRNWLQELGMTFSPTNDVFYTALSLPKTYGSPVVLGDTSHATRSCTYLMMCWSAVLSPNLLPHRLVGSCLGLPGS